MVPNEYMQEQRTKSIPVKKIIQITPIQTKVGSSPSSVHQDELQSVWKTICRS